MSSRPEQLPVSEAATRASLKLGLEGAREASRKLVEVEATRLDAVIL